MNRSQPHVTFASFAASELVTGSHRASSMTVITSLPVPMLLQSALSAKRLANPQDPLLPLAVAAAGAQTLLEFWQYVAQVLSATAGGGLVQLDFVDPIAVGSTEAGHQSEDSADPLTVAWGHGNAQRTSATVAPGRTSVRPQTVRRILNGAGALAELVRRRAGHDFERRKGNFLAELSLWMVKTSADPMMLVRDALQSAMLLARAQAGLVVVRGSESDRWQVLCAVGKARNFEAEALILTEHAVGEVVANGPSLLVPYIEAHGATVPDGIQGLFASAILGRLGTREDDVRGALCLLRTTEPQAPTTSFELADVNHLTAMASRISRGVELFEAIDATTEAAQHAIETLSTSPVPQALLSPAATIIRLNDAFADLFGLEAPAAVVGRKATSLPMAIKDGRLNDVLVQVRSGLPWQGRIHLIRGTDLRRCIAIATGLGRAAPHELLLVIRDRTEQFRTGNVRDIEPVPAIDPIIAHIDHAARVARVVISPSPAGEIKERIDVHDVLRGVLDIRSRVLGAPSAEIRTDFMKDVLEIVAIPTDLQQVFAQLIANAVDAVGEYETRQITIDTERVHSCVRVIVSDSGSGVQPELRTRVFDPFFSTKGAAKTAGLGLAMTKRIVSALGGKIWVEDGDLGGARFVVELPLSRPWTTNEDH